MIDLKQVMMELGNRLVLEHDFLPAACDNGNDPSPSTIFIEDFTIWVNNNPEVREELKKLGIDWPM